MELEAILVVVTSVVGFITLTTTLVPLMWWVWVTFLRPPKNLRDYGSWALITGSTDGIGKALAFELASQGFNLILISRDPSKLELTSNEIRHKYGSKIEVKYRVVDFSKDNSDDIVRKIEEEIHGLDVGMVINNAGMAYPCPKYYHEVERELLESINKVNMEAATWVTKAVLPVMLKKKKGAIVNIGSGAGKISSMPLYALYAATKAYIGMFSRSMTLEYKKHGIDVQCQTPLFVMTKMTPMTRPSFFVPSPEMYSKASVRRIGYEHTCMPYWTHCLQWHAMRTLPEALLDRIRLYIVLSFKRGDLPKISGFGL